MPRSASRCGCSRPGLWTRVVPRALIDLDGPYELDRTERKIPEGERQAERERLTAELEAILARGAVPRAEPVDGELPRDVQDALRELGYAE